MTLNKYIKNVILRFGLITYGSRYTFFFDPIQFDKH